MTTVKNQWESVRRDLISALVDLFKVDISYKEKKYFYIKHISHNPIKTDWENIGRDLRKSMDQFENVLEENKLEDRQYSFDFDNSIENNGEREAESGEKQPA